MLATDYKSVLPKGWSYPIGAQDLTAFLEAVPGSREKPISFSARSGWFHSRLDALRRDDHPYVILRVRYGRDRFFGEDPESIHWDVQVFAVPSTLRAAVRQSLIPGGMRLVATWLGLSRPDTSLDAGPTCSLLVRESDALLYFEHRDSRFEDTKREAVALPSGRESQ